jgi:cell division protein FtsI/penicillin-binding protein 2
MPFSAAVQAGTPVGRWSYRSALTAYPKRIDGYSRWFVRWAPQLPFASLKAGDTLKIKKIPARVAGAADRNGRPIDPAAHPGLSALVGTLTSKPAPPSHDGQDVVVVAANGTEVATVGTLTEPVAGFVTATTLDLTVQSAAEAAVTFRANSSMVAIQPSTGHILAFANNTTSQYYDDALLARVAPGSTFKIITSTMLLANNLVTLDATAPCPTTLDVDGLVLHNSEGDGGTDSTYAVDFAQSCNNAFSTFYDAHGMTPDLLADTAKKYFGLNQSWDIGLGETAQYMTVPSGLNGAALAESLVGQGDVVSCPLAMCSVAATVAAGEFRQPILMPGAAQPPVTALGTELQAQLKTLMASVVAPGGTAAAVGFPGNGHFFAKTGTAEVGSGANLSNNSWFVVFDDRHDIALGALSVDGGYGAAAAGAECLTAMRRLGYA